MKYLSVCSGIEAASVAWHPLRWQPLAFSEIEPFPRAVLAHHYPDVPCHGDFTALRDQPWIVDADVLVGGTPCQTFSVAGLRNSLADDRGNLSLEFVRLADAIDNVRKLADKDPAIIVWENVPGVLSVKDNAFGCFLAGLAGDVDPYVPPRGKWTNAGVVDGPQRQVAWRVLDAQYFGLAQRRRRVFVIGYFGNWQRAAAVVFERKSLSRDTPQIIAEKTRIGRVFPCLTRRGLGCLREEEGLIAEEMGIRHLTPVECERLQGFPDNYTNIPWRKKKESPNGLRVSALGNSMAVPVMRWIGYRLHVLDFMKQFGRLPMAAQQEIVP